MIHIVLVEPQIPPNTGNIARLCAAMKVRLHLVKPLGFSTDDRYLKRAGLDYWPYVDLEYHECFDDFQEKYRQNRCFFLTTKSEKSYLNIEYQDEDILIFGSETTGLSKDILEKNWNQAFTIPMLEKNVRSLNLSTSVAIVLGEAIRQTKAHG